MARKAGVIPINGDVLNEVALMILDDEGQVAVADMVAEGNLFQAQVFLVRAAYSKKKRKELSEEEYVDLVDKVGVTRKDEKNMVSDMTDYPMIWD